MHVLQLSGRIRADVSVLMRRPGQRVAADSIEPRATALRFVDVSAGMAHLAKDAADILDRRDVAVAAPGAVAGGQVEETRVVAPWSVRRLGRLAGALGSTRYLEIGAGEGSTFSRVPVAERIGVDPRFPRDRSSLAGPGVQLEEVTSDAFFAELPATAAFDLILLDGLHTFEQTYRDLCSALMHMHRSTVILIDGTRPSDPCASVPDPQLARRLRDIDAVAGGAWQGDVFKVVYALHDFHLELDYRTIVGPGLPQTLVWRSDSMERLPRFGSLGAIDRLTYFDMLDQWEVMQACPEDEALGRCMNALSAHAG